MGTDKALVPFAGAPLIQHAIKLFAAANLNSPTNIRVAGSRSDLSAFAETIPDTSSDIGPIRGIHAALAASRSRWNLFLPVDMPLIPSSFLACLLERARLTGAAVTAVRRNGRLEPFPVLLDQSIYLPLTRYIESGQTASYRAWQTLPVDLDSYLDAPAIEDLTQSGHIANPLSLRPNHWFRSCNTPTDLAFLLRLYNSALSNAQHPLV